jgi:hypothetical protein
MAVVGDDEPVQIKLETVLHSGTVDLTIRRDRNDERLLR